MFHHTFHWGAHREGAEFLLEGAAPPALSPLNGPAYWTN